MSCGSGESPAEMEPLPDDLLAFILGEGSWRPFRASRRRTVAVGGMLRHELRFTDNGGPRVLDDDAGQCEVIDDAGVYVFEGGLSACGLAEAAIAEATDLADVSHAGGWHSPPDVFQKPIAQDLRVKMDAAVRSLPARRAPDPRPLAGFDVTQIEGARVILHEEAGDDEPKEKKPRWRLRLVQDDSTDDFWFDALRKDVECSSKKTTEAWYNVVSDGHFHCLHDHLGVAWAGTTWLRIPEPPKGAIHSGALVLVLKEENDSKGPGGTYSLLSPYEGQTVIFASSLKHAVLPLAPISIPRSSSRGPPGASSGARRRVSLSFNHPGFSQPEEEEAAGAAPASTAAAAA